MPVHSAKFDVRDSDLDTQIGNEESGITATSIDDRLLASEGNNHVRVVWFYTA